MTDIRQASRGRLLLQRVRGLHYQCSLVPPTPNPTELIAGRAFERPQLASKSHTGARTLTTEPPGLLSGRVLLADSFAVPTTDTNFQVQPFSSGGTLPQNIGPTAGQLLVLSMKDVSRPGLVCTGGIASSNCAILIALPSRDEGFVSVALASGRQSLYLQSTYRLELDPEPA